MFFRNGQAEQYRRVLGEREEGIGKVYLPPSAAREKHLKISQCFLGSASLVSCPMPPWQLCATQFAVEGVVPSDLTAPLRTCGSHEGLGVFHRVSV